jgi:hypothetical protein
VGVDRRMGDGSSCEVSGRFVGKFEGKNCRKLSGKLGQKLSETWLGDGSTESCLKLERNAGRIEQS